MESKSGGAVTQTKGASGVVVIGASAGAVHALAELLPRLPKEFPMPVLVVVHLPPDRESAIHQLLGARSLVKVKEAEDKELAVPGAVYFAPPNYHLLLEQDGTLSLSMEEEVGFSRPSIDVLFESSADACGPDVLAIILTGANIDGAQGVRAVAAQGGRVLVQDPEEAQAREMPEAAAKAVERAEVLSLGQISEALTQLARGLVS